MKLDDRDRTIISMYSSNPNVSQEEIASAVNLSQPSVAARIRKLRSMGALRNQAGIDPMAMGLYIAKVDLSCNDTSEVLDMFKDCPYFANGLTVSGRNNLCLFFVSESISTLESIVNHHLRSKQGVKNVDFNIVIGTEKNITVPIKLTPGGSKAPPCGINVQCKNCPPFKSNRCSGCPAIGQYQGWLY